MVFLVIFLLIAGVFLLIGASIYKEKRRKKREAYDGPKSMEEFRRQVIKSRLYWILDLPVDTVWHFYSHFFFGRKHIRTYFDVFSSPFDDDIERIWRFDKRLREGERVPFPKMRTEEGERYWSQYIKLRFEDSAMSEEEYEKQLIQAGGWRCSCKQVNSRDTSTCVCGKDRWEILKDTDLPPTPQSWQCVCGRENPPYTSTCVCGKTKPAIRSSENKG